MCQSNAYLLDGGREELVLEDVALVEVGRDQVKMRTLFGEPVSLRARVREIDLTKNRIVLERCEEVDIVARK
jgi:predicted RNA-binding protein